MLYILPAVVVLPVAVVHLAHSQQAVEVAVAEVLITQVVKLALRWPIPEVAVAAVVMDHLMFLEQVAVV